MSQRGFRDSFRSYVPAWLQNRLGKNVGYRLLWALFTPLDVAVQAVLEVAKAAFPGLGTNETALPLIGRSRGIQRGEGETAASYEIRLQEWIDTWRDAGSDVVVAKQIQAYLGNSPRVRIVSRGGHWTTLASDGTITTNDVAWDWDSISNPERNDPSAPYWSDLWIIVYPPPWAITGSSLAALVGVWGTGSGLGCGHAVDRMAYDAILSLVATWKGAHTRVRAVIWSYDSALFDPANLSSLPDGHWGKWGKDDPANPGHTIASRSSSARYWIPPDTFPADPA